MRDVVHERRVRPDDEHAPQLLAMRIEEPRRAMQADRGLPRTGAALHDERAVRLRRDQPVLIRLDRRDDVAHPSLTPAVELLEQEVRHRRTLDRGAVERLVGDVDDPPPVRAVSPPLRHALRIGGRRRIERTRGRRLPVDDERLRLLVLTQRRPTYNGRSSPSSVSRPKQGRSPRPRTCAHAASPMPPSRAPRTPSPSLPACVRASNACGRGIRTRDRCTLLCL